jgi:hypothetical protein
MRELHKIETMATKATEKIRIGFVDLLENCGELRRLNVSENQKEITDCHYTSIYIYPF